MCGMTMKNKWILAFIFAIFVILLYPSLATASPCEIPSSGEPVVHVWPSGDGKCTDLRAAVESANSYSGSGIPKIIVHQGSYFLRPENDPTDLSIYKHASETGSNHGLLIKRPVVIEAAEGEDVLIDFMGAKRGIIINSSHVSLDGIKLTNTTKSYIRGNTEAAVYVYNSQRVRLNNLTVFNARQIGVVLIGSAENPTTADISNSSFYNHNYADIELMGYAGANITDNLFYGHDSEKYNYSIAMFGPSYAYIFNNTFYNYGTAIRIYDIGGAIEGKKQRGSIAAIKNRFKSVSVGIKIDPAGDIYRGERRISPLYNFDWNAAENDFKDSDSSGKKGAGNVFDGVGVNCQWWNVDVYDTSSPHWKRLTCNGKDCSLASSSLADMCPTGTVQAPTKPDVSYPSESNNQGNQNGEQEQGGNEGQGQGQGGAGNCFPSIYPPRFEALSLDRDSIKVRIRHRGIFGCNHELIEEEGDTVPHGSARMGSIIKVCLKNPAGNERCKTINMAGMSPRTGEQHPYVICGIGSHNNPVYSDCDGKWITIETSSFNMAGSYIIAYADNGTSKAWSRKISLSPVDHSRNINTHVSPNPMSKVTKDTEFSVDVENVGGVDVTGVSLFVDRNADGKLNLKRLYENCGREAIGKWCDENGNIGSQIEDGKDVVYMFCRDDDEEEKCNIRNRRTVRYSTDFSLEGADKVMIPIRSSGDVNFKTILRVSYAEGGINKNFDTGYWYISSSAEGENVINTDGYMKLQLKRKDGKFYATGFTKQSAMTAFVACGRDVDGRRIDASKIRKSLVGYYKPIGNNKETVYSFRMSYFPLISGPGGFFVIPLNENGNQYSSEDANEKCILYHVGRDVNSFTIEWKGPNIIGNPRGYLMQVDDSCKDDNAYFIDGVIGDKSTNYEVQMTLGEEKKLSELEAGKVYKTDTNRLCKIKYENPSVLDICYPRKEGNKLIVHVWKSGNEKCTDIFKAVEKARDYCEEKNCYDNPDLRPTIIIHDNNGRKTEYALSQPSGSSEVIKLDFPVILRGTGMGKVTLKFERKSDVPDININSSHVKIASINLSDETPEAKGRYSDVIFANPTQSSHLEDIVLSNIFVTGEHADDGISLSHSSANITNTMISNTGTNGILLIQSYSANITNTMISNTGTNGILLIQSSSANITNTRISDTGYIGIFLAYSSSANITNTRISDTGYIGIGIHSSSANITNTRISDTGYIGIGIHSSSANITNTMISNTGTNGILLTNSSSANITNTRISNTGTNGIFLTQSSSANITNTRIFGTGRDGIYISESSANITNTKIADTDNNEAITVTGHSMAVIRNSEMTGGRVGIWVEGESSSYVIDNKIGWHGEAGVKVIQNSKTYLKGNEISNIDSDHTLAGLYVREGSKLVDDGGNELANINERTLVEEPYSNIFHDNKKNCEIHYGSQVIDCESAS